MIVTANDFQRLSKTLRSLPTGNICVEYVFVSPDWNTESNQVLNSFIEKKTTKSKIILDQGLGIYQAMEIGARASSGRYICFWNSGDRAVSSHSLIELTKTLEGIDNEWAIFLGVSDWQVTRNLSHQSLRNFICNKQGYFISHQTVLFNRDTYLAMGGYDFKLKVAADTKIITQFFKLTNPKLIDIAAVNIEHPSFASTNNRRARFECILIVLTTVPLRLKMEASRNILSRELNAIKRKVCHEKKY